MDRRTVPEEPQNYAVAACGTSLGVDAVEVGLSNSPQLATVLSSFATNAPLRALASESGISDFDDLHSTESLLFKHSVLESYPVSLIKIMPLQPADCVARHPDLHN